MISASKSAARPIIPYWSASLVWRFSLSGSLIHRVAENTHPAGEIAVEVQHVHQAAKVLRMAGSDLQASREERHVVMPVALDAHNRGRIGNQQER